MIADPDRYMCTYCDSLICSENPGEINKYYDEGNNIHVIDYSALEQAEEKIKSLEANLSVAKDYLEKINNEELNSQRPGGGYSKSATLSYEALEKLK